MRNAELKYWMVLIGMVLVLVGKDLFAEGMFLDGVLYASISRNLACGMGDFWNPHYTQTIGSVFHSHPPLAFGLEALMFKAFGDHFFMERIYSLLMFLLSGLTIVLIWKRTTNNIRLAWLPLLYWIAIPLVTWSENNNMLENTMTVFVLLSIYLMVVGVQNNNRSWFIFAGISLFAAFMTKGFTGLFPLTFPLIYSLFDENYKLLRGIIDSLCLLVSLAAVAGLMFWIFPPSLTYMKDYLHLQVLEGGLHEVTVNSRFFIVLNLLQQMIIPLLVFLLLLIIVKISHVHGFGLLKEPSDRKGFLVFLVLGLSGVLPIMVSLKQSGYYMVAALPCFALALGHVSNTLIRSMESTMKPNRYWRVFVTGLSYTVLVIGLMMPLFGIHRYCRDEALLEDVKKVLTVTGDEQVLGIASEDFSNWEWHAYFMRYGKVSLDDKMAHPYILRNDPNNGLSLSKIQQFNDSTTFSSLTNVNNSTTITCF